MMLLSHQMNINIHKYFLLIFVSSMNQTSSLYSDHPRSTVIDPYYVKGDVFQRDSRYYDQLIGTRRNRTPNKSVVQQPTQISNIRPTNDVIPSTVVSGPVVTSTYSQPTVINNNVGPIQSTVPNQPFIIQTQTTTVVNDPQEIRRLQEEHQLLLTQMQQLSSGGNFGTSDVVVKKHHYVSQRAENTQIQQQQQKIRAMQDEVKRNNEKLIKFQKASNELQIRMNNIQAIDKEIYKQLKSANTRDKELLERVNGALLRGEPKENVLRILQQIVIS